MGLDIYLYRYNDIKKYEELQSEYDRRQKEIWDGNDVNEKYNLLTQEQKDKYRDEIKEMALSLGLSKWGDDYTNRENVEIESLYYPEHLFKIGYFRSSYNEGGIDRILRNMGLPTMSDVFEYDGEYRFKPNWENALSNINDLIKQFTNKGAYRVRWVSNNFFKPPTINSEKEALDAFIEELKKDNERTNDNSNFEKYNYSNSVGEFSFNEPLKVLAMIPGTHDLLGRRECVYIVTESDNTWYIQALEIIKETIEWVLSRDDKELYYLHWSG